MNRNLDGCYFRIERNGEFQNVCFSDLTEEEREYVATLNRGRSAEWWQSLCYHLADQLQQLGEEFGLFAIVGEDED